MRVVWKKLLPEARVPTRAHENDAGYDLYTAETFVTRLDWRSLDTPAPQHIRTGIAVAMPPGYWLEIVPRSSTFRRYGIVIGRAIIDEGFRGELFVTANEGVCYPITVYAGTRVAQVIFHKVVEVEWEEVDELPPSERGENGWGSTGE
jgi:dUTP pyrophosphatase